MTKTATIPTLKSLMTELVQMPTLSHETATCEAALDWIRYQVRDLPVQAHDFKYNGHSALVLTTHSTKRPKVMLHTHIDISPAPVEQIKLTERDGKYFGRGVFDMKYAAATYIRLLLELGESLPEYSLGATFTSSEEVGCHDARGLAENGWGGEVIINPDAVPGWDIQRSAKGILRTRIHSWGQPGHGSRPWQYRNAITQLSNFLGDLSAQFTQEPCGDPEHNHPTLNVGVFHGGDIANQVAAQAYADIDMRLVAGQTVAEAKAFIETRIADHEHLTAEHMIYDEPVHIDTTLPPVQLVRRLITEVAGVEPQFILAHGGSEAGLYTAKGIPVIMFGPDGGGHHSSDEWISARGVEQFAQIVRRFVDEMAKI